MSNTYRDKLRAQARKSGEVKWDVEYETIEYTYVSKYSDETYTGRVYIKRAGVLTKKKRSYLEFEHRWYAYTPNWWVREYMTVPKRAKCSVWERQAVRLVDIEDVEDCPDYGRKPHLYYW